MLTKEEFIKKVSSYNPNADFIKIEKAYDLAKHAHEGQKRESGEPYFEHPAKVAEYLLKLKAGSSTLCAGLLHDVVEDTTIPLAQIKKEFGEDIATIVESLTKIDKIYFAEWKDYRAENLRKILLATAKDFRVMLVKLCDRLHNMETLQSLPKDRQRRNAIETLQIYAPIAHKLGIWAIKGKLEDLSLKCLEPEIYKTLKNKIDGKRSEREEKTKDIIKTIKDKLSEANIQATVKGRAKYFYSIYRKMIQEKKTFDEIFDLIAVRIIAKSIPDCYEAIRIIHTVWQPNMERFKDYIKTPKPNLYQSIHSTVKVDEGTSLEVQIRTEEMHYHSEEGIAAHWRYKGTDRDKKFDKKISWLKQLLEWRQNTTDDQVIEDLILDLFKDEIVVFTPKGDPVSLPEASTPIDFAYEIHTSIGNHCVQATVNKKTVPLYHTLRSGDVVEITTKKNANPSRHWLSFVKTHLARNKIKSTLGLTQENKNPKKEDNPINYSNLLNVKGKHAPLKLSKCCDPIPGDELSGYYTKDKKITVHKISCSNNAALLKNKLADVSWLDVRKEEFITLTIIIEDRVGVLTDLLSLVTQFATKVYSVNTKAHKSNLVITLTTTLLNDAQEFKNRLKGISGFVNIHIL